MQTLLSPEGRFNMDKKAALLQATDFPDRLDQIQLYLDAVHNRATRQVQIQAKVIEVVLNDEFAAGIDWQLPDRARRRCGIAHAERGAGLRRHDDRSA